MLVIGLSGRAMSGKDTVASMMMQYCSEHDLVAEKHAFADPVKLMVERLDPYVRTEVNESQFSRVSTLLAICDSGLTWSQKWDQIKAYPDVRRLLQRMGTDAGRETLGSSIWVDQMMRRIEASHADVLIVSDVRFPQEQNLIHAVNGCNAHIERENGQTLGSNASHVSENSLDMHAIDCVIENTSLEALDTTVKDFMSTLLRNEV